MDHKLITIDDIQSMKERYALISWNTLYNANIAYVNKFNKDKIDLDSIYDYIIVLETTVLFDKIVLLPTTTKYDDYKLPIFFELNKRNKILILDLDFSKIVKKEIGILIDLARTDSLPKFLIENEDIWNYLSDFYSLPPVTNEDIHEFYRSPMREFSSFLIYKFKTSFFEFFGNIFSSQRLEDDSVYNPKEESNRYLIKNFYRDFSCFVSRSWLYYSLAGFMGISFIPSIYRVPFIEIFDKYYYDEIFTDYSDLEGINYKTRSRQRVETEYDRLFKNFIDLYKEKRSELKWSYEAINIPPIFNNLLNRSHSSHQLLEEAFLLSEKKEVVNLKKTFLKWTKIKAFKGTNEQIEKVEREMNAVNVTLKKKLYPEDRDQQFMKQYVHGGFELMEAFTKSAKFGEVILIEKIINPLLEKTIVRYRRPPVSFLYNLATELRKEDISDFVTKIEKVFNGKVTNEDIKKFNGMRSKILKNVQEFED